MAAGVPILKADLSWRNLVVRVLPSLAIFVVLMVVWESGVFHDLLGLELYTVPYPSSMVAAVGENQATLIEEMLKTFTAAGIGYVIGSPVGVAVAVVMSEVPLLRRYLLPVASGFSAMPVLATAPLMALYFGLGYSAAVAVVVVMTVPPTVISVFKGLTTLDNQQRELMDSVAATRRDVLFKLKFPSAMPYLFTSLKLNVTLALVGAIVTEFVTSQRGLGTVITRSLTTFDMPIAWGAMALVAVLGVAWFQLVQVAERLSIGWHESFR